MKRFVSIIVLVALFLALYFIDPSGVAVVNAPTVESRPVMVEAARQEVAPDSVVLPSYRVIPVNVTTIKNVEAVVEPEYGMPDEDIYLIALLTMAEAEGEPAEGKRWVIDTVLNRMDHWAFPDTAYDVIYQPYHFESVWNGRIDRCTVTDEVIDLVKEELIQRKSATCIYFCAGGYSAYGTPICQIENHFFSTY